MEKFGTNMALISCLVMLGIFHTIMFLEVMGKQFPDAGLKVLLIQSGIVAEGSIDKSLCGKQYNRSVRTVKLVYEVFSRILDKMQHEQYENEFELLFYNLKDKIKDFNSNINEEQFETLTENNIFTNYLNLVIDSTCNLIENGGDLAKFWLSFVNMAELVLNLIAATRLGHWYLFFENLKRYHTLHICLKQHQILQIRDGDTL